MSPTKWGRGIPSRPMGISSHREKEGENSRDCDAVEEDNRDDAWDEKKSRAMTPSVVAVKDSQAMTPSVVAVA